jgi:hypothetical protein
LGERLLCKQEVDGSIPFTSTSLRPRKRERLPRATARQARLGQTIGKANGIPALGHTGSGPASIFDR